MQSGTDKIYVRLPHKPATPQQLLASVSAGLSDGAQKLSRTLHTHVLSHNPLQLSANLQIPSQPISQRTLDASNRRNQVLVEEEGVTVAVQVPWYCLLNTHLHSEYCSHITFKLLSSRGDVSCAGQTQRAQISAYTWSCSPGQDKPLGTQNQAASCPCQRRRCGITLMPSTSEGTSIATDARVTSRRRPKMQSGKEGKSVASILLLELQHVTP